MKATVYLVGATLLIDKLNLQSFEYVQNAFENEGFSCVKPHDLFTEDQQRCLSDDEQLNIRSRALDSCDFVVLIPGFDEDRFARAERSVAQFRGKPIHSLLEGIKNIANQQKLSA